MPKGSLPPALVAARGSLLVLKFSIILSRRALISDNNYSSSYVSSCGY